MTEKEIHHLAELSRIQIPPDQIEALSQEFDDILAMVGALGDLDPPEAPAYDLSLVNVFREDVVEPSTPREVLLAGAPDVEAGCYSVPKFRD